MKKEVREGYKMTELGEIPNEWEIKELKDLYTENIRDFGSFSTTKLIKYVDFGIPYLRSENFRENKLIFNSISYITDEVDKILDKSYVYKGNILFTKIGNIGCATVYKGELGERCNSNATIAKIKIDEKLYNPIFIMYFLNSVQCKKQYIGSIVSTPPRINMGEINKFKVFIPRLEEQEKIAEVLSTLDEQIENTEKLIQKNQELKKGLMQQLLTKGIGHTEFKKTYLGDIPKEWHIINFFEFVNKIIDFRGRTPKKLGMDWGNGTILALSANNVKMGRIDFNLESYYASNELYEKWMGGNELSKGDLVMTMEAPLGNIAQIPDDEKYILSQRVVALKTNDNIDNEFMKYMLMSNNVQNQLDTLSTGTTAKGINQKNLSKVLIALPKIEEQRNIALILSVLDEKVKQYKYKKEKLEELKKGLMQQMLTGKIRLA